MSIDITPANNIPMYSEAFDGFLQEREDKRRKVADSLVNFDLASFYLEAEVLSSIYPKKVTDPSF